MDQGYLGRVYLNCFIGKDVNLQEIFRNICTFM